MPTANDPIPTKTETERQLARMLSSKRFAAALKQAPFLKYVVDAAIAGRPTDEDTIGYALFPGFKPDISTDVRVTAGNLRERLSDYYADEGRSDLVIITLPEPPPVEKGKRIKRPTGEAYRPSFAYNPNHPVDQDYRRGVYYLSQCTPGDDALALDHFGFALKGEPGHAASHVGKVEVFLRRAIYNPGNAPTDKNLALARRCVDSALRFDPTFWKAHAIEGVLYACHRNWEKARASFDRARAQDEFATCYRAWYYPAYLLALGQSDEALLLVRTRASENPDDLPSQLALGVFLYAAQRFDEAAYALATAQIMNPRHWLARVMSALLALAQREPATPHVILVHQLVGEDLFPGLMLLCYATDLRLRKTPKLWGPARRLADDLFSEVYKALDEVADTLPSTGQQLIGIVKHARKKYVSPVQLALAHMGVNHAAPAIRELKKGAEENSPLAAWLHLWPVLAPLAGKPEFKALLKRVRPPEAAGKLS